jgi:methyl-accepting chemotaxis protein
MARIDQTTQRNAALMEQAAAAARSMEAQAQGLAKSVAVFRVVKKAQAYQTSARTTGCAFAQLRPAIRREPGRRVNRK